MKQFEFTREFTLDGQVVSEADGRYVLREDCERRVAEARQEALSGVEQEVLRVVREIANNLNPVVPALTSIAGGLRREAVDLALAAAEAIAGAALDADMATRATEAVERVVEELKGESDLTLLVPQEISSQMEYHMERLVGSGQVLTFRIESHPDASPGDWRIVWDGGETSFDRARAVQTVRDAVENHLSEPPDVQGDLFGEYS